MIIPMTLRPYDEFLRAIPFIEGLEYNKEESRRIVFADDNREKYHAPVQFRELGLIKLVRKDDLKNFERMQFLIKELRSNGFKPHESGLEFLFKGESRNGRWAHGIGELRDETDNMPLNLPLLRLTYDVPCGTYELTHLRLDKPMNNYAERGTSKARIIIGFSFPDDNAIFL